MGHGQAQFRAVETSEREPPRQQARLAFASFLMLFVELALIRWTAANNVYVNNATNFVLLASFLGIGVGFLSARSGRDYLRWTPLALVGAWPSLLRAFSGRGGVDRLLWAWAVVPVLVLSALALCVGWARQLRYP